VKGREGWIERMRSPSRRRTAAARRVLRRIVKFYLRHGLEIDEAIGEDAARKLGRLIDQAQEELDVEVRKS
jgi:hypothetical protein